jgi:5-oxoprolinase (ATP-hydrolysing) subunit A
MDVIDLNCDMGESFGAWTMGSDAEMLKIVTSANVACGFHGGDPLVMFETVSRAKENGVGIGAHPSFFDVWGFGRRQIQGEKPEDIEKMVVYQIGALRGWRALSVTASVTSRPTARSPISPRSSGRWRSRSAAPSPLSTAS